jgi:hypothetical protein
MYVYASGVFSSVKKGNGRGRRLRLRIILK